MRVRRLLRTLPPLRIDGVADLLPWYLATDGTPVLVAAPERELGGQYDITIGGLPCDLLLSGEAQLVLASDGDDRDGRYVTALCPGGRRWRMDLPACLVSLAYEKQCALHLQSFSALDLANAFGVLVESRMVAHMNEDHVDALRSYCHAARIVQGAEPPVLLGLDMDGFDLNIDKRISRIEFENEARSALAVRQALVSMAQRARA